ncbi:hypothetical protein CBL_11449 [Carabus blaptoides fortunei]
MARLARKVATSNVRHHNILCAVDARCGGSSTNDNTCSYMEHGEASSSAEERHGKQHDLAFSDQQTSESRLQGHSGLPPNREICRALNGATSKPGSMNYELWKFCSEPPYGVPDLEWVLERVNLSLLAILKTPFVPSDLNIVPVFIDYTELPYPQYKRYTSHDVCQNETKVGTARGPHEGKVFREGVSEFVERLRKLPALHSIRHKIAVWIVVLLDPLVYSGSAWDRWLLSHQ